MSEKTWEIRINVRLLEFILHGKNYFNYFSKMDKIYFLLLLKFENFF